MQITTKISFLGLVLALSSLNLICVQANAQSLSYDSTGLDIEQRLARITLAIQQRESQLRSNSSLADENAIAGWLNTRGGSWGKTSRGGFINDRGGGGFINQPRWGDGGRFYNRGWGNGGSWGNRGGFINRY